MLWLLGMLACDEVVYDPSSIESLEVVTIVAEPPEVTAGESFELTAWVANPEGVEMDLLLWPCTAIGGACVEAGPVPRPLPTWTRVVRNASQTETVRFDVPAVLAQGLDEADTALTFLVWALACKAGECGIIDDVDARPEAGTAAWTRVAQDLSSPDLWLREEALTDASLALRRVVLSDRPLAERNTNPVLATDAPSPLVLAPSSFSTLVFSSVSGVEVRLASTGGGGFGVSAVGMNAGSAVVRWTAPAVPGTSTLWAVVEDGAGGATVWNGQANVVDP